MIDLLMENKLDWQVDVYLVLAKIITDHFRWDRKVGSEINTWKCKIVQVTSTNYIKVCVGLQNQTLKFTNGHIMLSYVGWWQIFGDFDMLFKDPKNNDS